LAGASNAVRTANPVVDPAHFSNAPANGTFVRFIGKVGFEVVRYDIINAYIRMPHASRLAHRFVLY
jgi:hypothetical protein